MEKKLLSKYENCIEYFKIQKVEINITMKYNNYESISNPRIHLQAF